MLNWNIAFFLVILKKSLPFALLVLLMSFYNRIDPVLIRKLVPGDMGDYQAGVYAQAFRLLDAGQNFAFLFSVLLLPLFSKIIKDGKNINELVRLAFSILVTGALIIAISVGFYSDEIMGLMYGHFETETAAEFALRISQSSTVLTILMFSFVAISSNYIFGTLLTANKSLKALNMVAFAGLVANIAVNLLLIPKLMAIGSAWASLFAQGGTAFLQIVLVKQIFKMKTNVSLLIRFSLLVSLMVAAGFALRQIPLGNWLLSISVLLFGGLALAFLLKLLDLKEMLRILKQDS
jgi:O-antigen/teichoic acid export membrane protein